MKKTTLKTVPDLASTLELHKSFDDSSFGRNSAAPDFRQFIEYSGGAACVSTFDIPLVNYQTIKSIKVETVVHSSVGEKDEHYYCRVRKQALSAVQVIVEKLKDKQDIQAWTANILAEIQYGIERIGQSETAQRCEGNTAEILRILRDSLTNKGWKKYAEPKVQLEISNAISKLSSFESIEPEHVESLMNLCDELGLEYCATLSVLAEMEFDLECLGANEEG